MCRSSCTADGFHIFGPQQPTLILGQQLTLRLPRGITLSARGEYEITDYVTALAARQPVRVVEATFWLPIGTVEIWHQAQEMDLESVLTRG